MRVGTFILTHAVTAFVMLGVGWKYAPQLDATISPCAWGIEAADGDTIRCNGRLIRIKGLNSAEIRKPTCPFERELALKAKARLEDLLPLLDSLPRKTGSSGGFGRWQTDLSVKGVSVAEILIGEGLAVRSGPHKAPHDWCTRVEV